MRFSFSARRSGLLCLAIALQTPFAEGDELVPRRLPPVASQPALRVALSKSLPRATLPPSRLLPAEQSVKSELPPATPRSETVVDPLNIVLSLQTPDWSAPKSPLPPASEQAAALVRRASLRASRGAIYAARHELEVSLSILSRALDVHYRTTAFTQCFEEGMLALKEAGDFSRTTTMQRSVDVRLIVSKHRSRVLQLKDAQHLTPEAAAQEYYAFAQNHLAAATGGAPVAARALFGLGKIYTSMCEAEADSEQLYGPRAMVMHQTALTVDQCHHLAANELGLLLVRFGRYRDAEKAFVYGLSLHQSPEMWYNLADVHLYLGDGALAQSARAEGIRVAQRSEVQPALRVTVPNGLTIQWVDNAAFERASAEIGGNTPPPSHATFRASAMGSTVPVTNR